MGRVFYGVCSYSQNHFWQGNNDFGTLLLRISGVRKMPKPKINESGEKATGARIVYKYIMTGGVETAIDEVAHDNTFL